MWSIPQSTADMVTYVEEILNGKLPFFFCAMKPTDLFKYNDKSTRVAD